MKAIVTGGAGFIGSHLVDALIGKDYRVGIIDNLSTGKAKNLNAEAHFFNIDIKDEKIEKIFNDFKPDLVFHLASQISVTSSLNDPCFDASENVLGTINILKAAAKAGVKKLVFSSSAAVYGDAAEQPVTEDCKIKPISFYGLSKYSAEMYILLYSDLFSLPSVILRFSNVYGPRQSSEGEAGVVAIFIEKALRRETPVIYGDGEQTRDFIYVKDVVEASIVSADNATGVFNVGTGKESSINELWKIIKEQSGTDVREKYGPERKGDIRRMRFSIEKIKKEFGWKPLSTLPSGVKETISGQNIER